MDVLKTEEKYMYATNHGFWSNIQQGFCHKKFVSYVNGNENSFVWNKVKTGYVDFADWGDLEEYLINHFGFIDHYQEFTNTNNKKLERITYFNKEDFVVDVHLREEGLCTIDYTGSNFELLEFVKVVHGKFFKQSKADSVYMITDNGNGIGLTPIGVATKSIIKENYSKEVIVNYEKLVKGVVEKDPFGRLSLIYGEPGTGKTYLIRALTGDAEGPLFVILPSAMLSAIDNPQFASLLLRYSETDRPIVLILEDADSCLVRRGADNMSSISALLNLTDGIFGTLLDLRVVATTNAKHIDIEEALLRPGRIHNSFNVGKLSKREASKSFKNITGKDRVFDKSTTLAEVYAATKEKEPTKVKFAIKQERTMGFGI